MRGHSHSKKLEPLSGPVKMNGCAISVWEWYLTVIEFWSGPIQTNQGANTDTPVPRRKTAMWLIEPASTSSKIACVSSICCKFVCRRRPATRQPNIALYLLKRVLQSFGLGWVYNWGRHEEGIWSLHEGSGRIQ